MVPLDRALVSSYRLSIVTVSLSAAVWPQLALYQHVSLIVIQCNSYRIASFPAVHSGAEFSTAALSASRLTDGRTYANTLCCDSKAGVYFLLSEIIQ